MLARRLLFVTGKGGTGKTTVAAALARHAASTGSRVLVVEMDEKGALAAALGCGPLSFEPAEVAPNLSAMAMNTEDSLREYIRLFVRMPIVTTLGPLARILDFVANAAPGVKEILAVGKVCWEVRERRWDLVIVDAEASGHVVAQVDAPRSLAALVPVGLIRDQVRWMQELLSDPSTTGIVVAALAEEIAVNETVALLDRLAADTAVAVAAVVCNRVPASVVAEADDAAFDALLARTRAGSAGGPLAAPLELVAVAAERRRRAMGHLRALLERAARVPAPVIVLPEVRTGAVVDRLVDDLAGELS
ncbi:MAG: anion-transporting ATPase [Actinobacteria bacterium]|nr:anion-transporting ATPase [Actinomycetota bacterium]